ncbi:hypothetical protein WJX73_004679 [Symbiochloris irregularis]|uniref:Serine/threonine-protein phosphatase 4 regulatory subunit 3-like central domain-containing protein n=1 Tax=Symbiochloris irregularis TaxID=706552 RepID=A0AAW1NX39_9CHLO
MGGEDESGPQPGGASDFQAQRVKVYRLNNEGLWDDKGTGHVSVEYMEKAEAAGLIVISEEDRETLLIHKVSSENIYQQQGEETIISWTDPGIGSEIALSFQEAAGCRSVWDQITNVQRHANGSWRQSPTGAEVPEEPEHLLGPGGSSTDSNGRRFIVDEFESASVSPSGNLSFSISQNPIDVPAPELRNLPELAKILAGLSVFQRERVAAQMARPKYVRQLLDIFRMCEDLEDEESLHHLYVIVKGVIMLNSIALMEVLFAEDNVMDVVGALEYDKEASAPARHREWLSEKVVFKEVVPISDARLREKIHQTYRMGYVKDVILPRTLDDATFATLSSLMLFNNVEVVMALQSDSRFLPHLFYLIKQGPDTPSWAELVGFLQEMTGLAKNLQPNNRTSLFSTLTSLGLFQVLTTVLEKGGEELQLRAMDILLSSVQHDSRPLRDFLLQQQDHALLSLLVRPLREGGGGGLQEGALECLRYLLDPEGMTVNVERAEFLDAFYNKHMGALVGVLSETPKSSKSANGATQGPQAGVQGLILELLCFCVVHHGYRMKYFVLGNNLLPKVLKLLKRKERWLAVAAVRFMRTCLHLKDEFYNRYMVRENCIEPIVEAFLANGPRYNLLNSAVLEMFEFMRRESMRVLIAHTIERFWERLERVDYVDTFKALKLKHDQVLNQAFDRARGAGGSSPGGPEDASGNGHAQPDRARPKKDPRALDRDEEDYFREGDDDDDDSEVPSTVQGGPSQGRGPLSNGTAEHSSGLPRPLTPLVDYGDDDDDESDASGFLGHKRKSPSPSFSGKRSYLGPDSPRGLQISPLGPLKNSSSSSDKGGLWQSR